MKGPAIKLLCTITVDSEARCAIPGLFQMVLDQELERELRDLSRKKLKAQLEEPICLDGFLGIDRDWWLFRNRVLLVENAAVFSKDELLLHIKRHVFQREDEFNRVRREVRAFENMERLPSARREKIPDSVRLFVWQRDEGKCVNWGNKEKLEFDHIIPVAKGGNNTERNIQLLCEQCNRQKGKRL